MIVFAFPAVIAGTALLEMERAFDWPFFDAARGGDPLLWQHLFWFFGHPEVYIIFLPATGMVSTMLPALVGTPLVGHRAVVAALVATGVISFALWAHHMFTAGLGSLSLSVVSAASMAIAIPSAVQVFAWIATLWRGTVRWNTPTLFILGFLVTFTFGGLTGVMVASLPFDWQVHDSYFIVAHLHYVLIGGMVMPVFAALYYWMPLAQGHPLSERAGRWVFGLVFGGFHLSFFPMHIAGILGMPRRVYTFDAGVGLEWPNLLSSIGAALLGAGVLLLALDVLRTLRRPRATHRNPWNAPTLEWVPADTYGPRSVPQVEGRYPLWQRPQLADEVTQGRHWLPGTALGLRETLVTTPWRAEPQHVIVLPGPGWMPLVGAFGTAAFFLLLTVKWMGAAFAFGIVAVVGVLGWLWQSDRVPVVAKQPVADVQVADRVRLPLGARRSGSHAWWATVVLLVVDFTVLASMAFSHLHVAMRLPVCPPPGSSLAPLHELLLVCGGFLASGALFRWWGRDAGERPLTRGRLALLGGSTAVLIGSFVLLLRGLLDAGLAPTASAWGATLAAVVSYLGFHVVLLVLAAGYLAARVWQGLATPWQVATHDNIALLWWGTCVQGIAVALLPQLVAAAMSR
jgi:cytochrome c oxidase subunit I+III